MKLFDRIMDVPSEKAVSNERAYEMYQFGGRLSLAGFGMIIAGFVAKGLGMEADGALVAGGSSMLLGGSTLVTGLTELRNS